jgi:hypothetical protein
LENCSMEAFYDAYPIDGDTHEDYIKNPANWSNSEAILLGTKHSSVEGCICRILESFRFEEIIIARPCNDTETAYGCEKVPIVPEVNITHWGTT